ncbi:hypothetical protein pipiens_019145 [Culex pipiens pipiens]|uniref:Uncharacterized protein n=1 Tax=Culex pipiens pipiens TaxID=38569 RepID=A0ABD1DW10_CULPP
MPKRSLSTCQHVSLNLASENAYFPSAQMANLFHKVSPDLGVASGSSGLRSDGRRPIARRCRCSFRLGTHKRERFGLRESQADVLTCAPTNGEPSQGIANVNAAGFGSRKRIF